MSCNQPVKQLVKQPSFQLLSADLAIGHIINDTVEYYFDKVRPLEMKILLKDTSEEWDRTLLLNKYKQFLIDDLIDFTDEEHKLVDQVFRKALSKHNQVFPNIELPLISLIKTKGDIMAPVFTTPVKMTLSFQRMPSCDWSKEIQPPLNESCSMKYSTFFPEIIFH